MTAYFRYLNIISIFTKHICRRKVHIRKALLYFCPLFKIQPSQASVVSGLRIYPQLILHLCPFKPCDFSLPRSFGDLGMLKKETVPNPTSWAISGSNWGSLTLFWMTAQKMAAFSMKEKWSFGFLSVLRKRLNFVVCVLRFCCASAASTARPQTLCILSAGAALTWGERGRARALVSSRRRRQVVVYDRQVFG